MKFNNKKHLSVILLLALFFTNGIAKGQVNLKDSLSLESIIAEVSQNHPLVKRALEGVNSSEAQIGAAESANKPNVDFTASVSHLGPVSEISIPGMSALKLMPKTNYSTTVSVTQNLYDFGKTQSNVELAEENKELSSYSVEQIRQSLSQSVISAYYTLLYIQETIKITDEQLNVLREHLRYVQKKMETGSATSYEVLSTEVRISALESDKTDLEANRKTIISQLNSLMGVPETSDIAVKNDLEISLPSLQHDEMISYALENRDEMKVALEREKMSELNYQITDLQNKPRIDGFVNGSINNGYRPDLNEPIPNFVVGVNLNVPIYDGKRKKYNLLQAESENRVNDQETENVRRDILNEVVQCEADIEASLKKIELSEMQLKQATKAYELAEVSYNAGVITNVELLDNSTLVSECRLQLLRAKIDYTVNSYSLKSAIGERLY